MGNPGTSADRSGAVFAPEPGLRGVLAPNPSPMTFRGTVTWIVGTGAVAVIDPGPDHPRHLAAILAALRPGETVSHIVVTHAHADHSALAPALRAATGAPVLGFGDAKAGRSAIMTALDGTEGGARGEGTDAGFRPDATLADGVTLAGGDWSLRALHTPGHFGNHISLIWGDAVFSGDHVMGWSSSVIAPPDGDMGDYMASLARLRAQGAHRLYPAHGDPVPDPAARIDALIHHRHAREAEILAVLTAGPADAARIARQVYAGTPAALLGAATMNVLAHLVDLTQRNRVHPQGPLTRTARFSRS